MQKHLAIVLFTYSFLVFPVVCTIAQEIHWRADRPLTWDDFRGKKDPASTHSAHTGSHIHYNFHLNLRCLISDSSYIKVDCLFDPEKSWKVRNGLSQYLLKHEQGHFDIAEIYAREMRKAFYVYISTHIINSYSKDAIKQMLDDMIAGLHSYQKKYDAETDHDNNKTTQEEWNKKIANELYELREYEVK